MVDGAAFGNFFSSTQHDDAMRQIEQRPDDVFYQEQGHPLIAQGTDEVDRLSGFGGREPGHELIQQQEFRRRSQGTRQLETFPVHHGECMGGTARLTAQADRDQEFNRFVASDGSGHSLAAIAQPDEDIF